MSTICLQRSRLAWKVTHNDCVDDDLDDDDGPQYPSLEFHVRCKQCEQEDGERQPTKHARRNSEELDKANGVEKCHLLIMRQKLIEVFPQSICECDRDEGDMQYL